MLFIVLEWLKGKRIQRALCRHLCADFADYYLDEECPYGPVYRTRSGVEIMIWDDEAYLICPTIMKLPKRMCSFIKSLPPRSKSNFDGTIFIRPPIAAQVVSYNEVWDSILISRYGVREVLDYLPDDGYPALRCRDTYIHYRPEETWNTALLLTRTSFPIT